MRSPAWGLIMLFGLFVAMLYLGVSHIINWIRLIVEELL